ncbi:MAG: hypothetical protein J6C01_03365 [Lachnospiraceae bacterium]|nr:hypothetical protein [Lachnospiraceae bacterium]
MRINETVTLDSDLSYGQYQESMKNMIVSAGDESKDMTMEPVDESEKNEEVAKVSISEESLSLLNKMRDDVAEQNDDLEKKETIKVGEFIGNVDMVYDENTKDIGAQEAYVGPTMIENKRVNFTI